MLPTHQRLRSDNSACPQIDLRLVIHHELFPLDGVTELSLQDQAFIGGCIEAIAIELKVIPPFFLGVIHRTVGIFE